MIRQLCNLLGTNLTGEKIRRVITVGNKVDRVADPHRTTVVTVCPGKFLDRIVGQIYNRDGVCASASVVAPIAALKPSWKKNC